MNCSRNLMITDCKHMRTETLIKIWSSAHYQNKLSIIFDILIIVSSVVSPSRPSLSPSLTFSLPSLIFSIYLIKANTSLMSMRVVLISKKWLPRLLFIWILILYLLLECNINNAMWHIITFQNIFSYIILFNSHYNPLWKIFYYYLYFTGEEADNKTKSRAKWLLIACKIKLK